MSQTVKSQTQNNNRSDTWIFGSILFFACVGLLASFVLSVEKLELLKNPDAVLSCSINLILNCASVMKTWQATLFGFPNSYIGLMAYPVMITMAVGYLAGARYKKWFMNGAQIGVGLGLLFAYWLFFQSVFVIQVLCPWCLFVTFSTTMTFEALLRYNLRENNFALSKSLHKKVVSWLKKDYDKFLVAAWLVAMVVLVLMQFPDIW